MEEDTTKMAAEISRILAGKGKRGTICCPVRIKICLIPRRSLIARNTGAAFMEFGPRSNYVEDMHHLSGR
jgi:hypothetical protein